MTAPALTALRVSDTLYDAAPNYIFTAADVNMGALPLTPEVVAPSLSAIPLPPFADLLAASVSQIHRDHEVPDPVYHPVVTAPLSDPRTRPGPLTLRCVNLAELTVHTAATKDSLRTAAFTLLTMRLLREADLSARELSQLTWHQLLSPELELHQDTLTLAADFAREDHSERLYPVAEDSLNNHLAPILARTGIGRGYTVTSGSASVFHDMAITGLLDPLSAPMPSQKEILSFLNSLKRVHHR